MNLTFLCSSLLPSLIQPGWMMGLPIPVEETYQALLGLVGTGVPAQTKNPQSLWGGFQSSGGDRKEQEKNRMRIIPSEDHKGRPPAPGNGHPEIKKNVLRQDQAWTYTDMEAAVKGKVSDPLCTSLQVTIQCKEENPQLQALLPQPGPNSPLRGQLGLSPTGAPATRDQGWGN